MSCRAVKLFPRNRRFNSSAVEVAAKETTRSVIAILKIIEQNFGKQVRIGAGPVILPCMSKATCSRYVGGGSWDCPKKVTDLQNILAGELPYLDCLTAGAVFRLKSFWIGGK